MTKPTISDAVKTLERKQLLVKRNDPDDLRSFDLILTEEGKNVAHKVAKFTESFTALLAELPETRKNQLDQTLTQLTAQLKELGILNAQRSCVGCKYSVKKKNQKGYYCSFLQEKMALSEIRLNCEYFQPAYEQEIKSSINSR